MSRQPDRNGRALEPTRQATAAPPAAPGTPRRGLGRWRPLCTLQLCCLLGAAAAVRAQSVEVREIPSPRPRGWVTDQTRQIPAADVAALNDLGDQVRRRAGAELAVVVVPTTGGRDPRGFATELFNHWGIGQAARDNGLLLFVALADRRAEIILGEGLDDPRRVQASQQIMETILIPGFRRGAPGPALLSGARRCAAELLGVDLEGPAAPARPGADAAPGHARAQRRVPGGRGGAPWSWVVLAAAAVGLGGTWVGVRRYLRHRTRSCPHCRAPMVLLGEAEDEAHLSPAERVEEHLGSVDYDVWSCPSCAHAVKLRYGAFFTSYSRCPKCRAITLSSTTRTLRSATRSRTGLEEITERCEHCSYRHVDRRRIPRLASPPSSSPSAGSSSGFSGSSGSSSGFSGGSSSGGGASGSW